MSKSCIHDAGCEGDMVVVFCRWCDGSCRWYPNLGLDFRLTVQLVDHSLSVNHVSMMLDPWVTW